MPALISCAALNDALSFWRTRYDAREIRVPPPPSSPLTICVLISGSGSTLANLIERIADGRLRNIRVVQVVSSRPGARGVEIAAAARIPVEIIRPRDYSNNADFGRAMHEAFRRCGAELVVMGGYLCFLPIEAQYARRVLNIHPALLPAFGGEGMFGDRVHEAVLAAGVKETGCTVHLADDQYDHGPIIAQKHTPVLPNDTPESLGRRVRELERELYPHVLQRLADRGLQCLDQPDRWA